jgi:hypothetical protein
MSKHLRPLVPVIGLLLLAPGFTRAQAPAAAAPAAPDRAAARGPADAAIAEKILGEVSTLRGLTILRPVSNGLKSRDAIRSMVLAELAEESTPTEMRNSTELLRFLGLVPSDFELERETVALLTEQIAGFYDPKTKVFYLADWIPVDEQRTVMAHELTHALTDQHFDLRRLEKWPDGDGDAELAAHALVEGDATAMMIEYELAQRGLPHDLGRFPVSLVDLLRDSAGANDPDHPVFNGAPAVMRETLQFPYVYGAGFVQALLRSGQWAKVSDAYRAMPASTEQVLHPEKYLANERPVAISIPDVSSLLGPGWKKIDEDVNGEYGYLLILKDKIPEREAAIAAAGWGGDRYAFYRDDKGSRETLVQVSAWDTPTDAAEFAAAYAARVRARYALADAGDAGENAKQWTTPQGLVRIERRGLRVVVVEAYRGDDVTAVFDKLWQ